MPRDADGGAEERSFELLRDVASELELVGRAELQLIARLVVRDRDLDRKPAADDRELEGLFVLRRDGGEVPIEEPARADRVL